MKTGPEPCAKCLSYKSLSDPDILKHDLKCMHADVFAGCVKTYLTIILTYS